MMSTNPSESRSKEKKRQAIASNNYLCSNSSSQCSSVDSQLGEIAITSDEEATGFGNIET